MLRHEDVTQHQAEAAGAPHPHRMPVVEDLGLAQGDDEVAGFFLAPRLVLTARANDRPLRMPATARERLAAGEPPAALRPGGHVVGNDGSDGERVLVVAPDVDLPLLRQAGDDPLQFGEHAVDPSGGRTAAGENFNSLQEDTHRSLMPSEPARPQQPKKAAPA